MNSEIKRTAAQQEMTRVGDATITETGNGQRESVAPACVAAPSATPETDAWEARYTGQRHWTNFARELERRLQDAETEHQMDQQVVANFEARVTELERDLAIHVEYGKDQQRHWCATACKERIAELDRDAEMLSVEKGQLKDSLSSAERERDALRAALVKLSGQLNHTRADVDHALWPTGGFAKVEKK